MGVTQVVFIVPSAWLPGASRGAMLRGMEALFMFTSTELSKIFEPVDRNAM